MTVSKDSDPEHQPIVPPWAGAPWCTCGWVPHDGFHIPADSILENYTIDNSAG